MSEQKCRFTLGGEGSAMPRGMKVVGAPIAFAIAGALFTLTAALPPAFALNPKRPITHYAKDVWRREKGLPQDSVNAILQSADGYLWLGTDDGLARFDGVDFEVYDHTNTNAFRQISITALCQTDDGTLWIGTNGGGVVRRGRSGWSAVGVAEGLPSDRILCLGPAPAGGVFVGTPTGLARLMPDGNVAPGVVRGAPPAEPAHAIVRRGRDGLIVATPKALLCTDGEGLKPFAPPLPEGTPALRCLIVRTDGTVVVGTEDGLYELVSRAWRRRGTADGLTSGQINCLVEDASGNLWAGTPLGLNRIKPEAIHNLTIKEGLPDNDIKSLFEDHEENLWVGTNGGGLVRMKDRIFSALSTTCGLCSDTVWSVFEAPDKTLWIGTEDGLAVYSTGRLDTLRVKDGLPSNLVRCVWVDRRGDLWAGTAASGLGRRHDGRWTTLTAPSPIPNNAVLVLYEDRKGTLWVGTNGGLATFDGSSWRSMTRADGLPDDRVRSIEEDREGTLWIGTYGGGLARFKDGRFEAFGRKDGLAGDNVWTTHADEDGTLWIGTGSGLTRYRGGRFATLTQKDGLFSDVVYTFLPDRRGQVWMSCNKGVSRVPLAALNDALDGKGKLDGVVPFGVSDGMSASECDGGSQPCGWISANGKLWFATVRGAMVVDPAEIRIDRRPPPVSLEAVRVDNVHQPNDGDDLVVGPGHKTLEIDYAGLVFSAPEKVTYRYRLAGFQDDWFQSGPHRAAFFTHVPPGRYTFEVQARLANGPWTDPPARLQIRLRPFFYQTLWFLVLCLLALAAAAVVVHRTRTRVLHRRQHQLETVVHERTSALQDANLKLEQANERLEALSAQDPLTGVGNRRMFDEVLEREWRRAQRSGQPLSLLMVDIDSFKPYNDAYGHKRGDECLSQVASALSSSANRASDLVARYGGEEFAVILPATSSAGATAIAEALRMKVEALMIPHEASATARFVTISIGVGTGVPQEGSPSGYLIERADKALYLAKQEGRNRVRTLA